MRRSPRNFSRENSSARFATFDQLEARTMLAADLVFYPGTEANPGPLISAGVNVFGQQNYDIYPRPFQLDTTSNVVSPLDLAGPQYFSYIGSSADQLFYWDSTQVTDHPAPFTQRLIQFDTTNDSTTVIETNNLTNHGSEGLFSFSRTTFFGDQLFYLSETADDVFEVRHLDTTTNSFASYPIENGTIRFEVLIGSNLFATNQDSILKIDTTNGGMEEIGISNVAPRELTPLGDDLFFTAVDSDSERRLHRLDSAGGVTVYGQTEDVSELTVAAGDLYFTGRNGNGLELRRIEGVTDTFKTFDVHLEFGRGDTYGLTTVGQELYFVADSGDAGYELRRLLPDSDAITTIDIQLGAGDSLPRGMTMVGSNLYFSANTAEFGRELYRLDTNTGQLFVCDVVAGAEGSSAGEYGVTSVGTRVFFYANVTGSGFQVVSAPQFFASEPDCDLIGFGDGCDGDDIDFLMAGLAGGFYDVQFDLNADGQLNADDRDVWLSEAGEQNLGPGRGYLLGDANLDAAVDGADFVVWSSNKFTMESRWTRGNFSVDGDVDANDFLLWNSNKFEVGGQLWTLRNREYNDRFVSNSGDNNAELSTSNDVESQWFVNTDEDGFTTFQSRATGRFLTAEDFAVDTREFNDGSTHPAAQFWQLHDNGDGSIAIQNLWTRNFLDGDGPNESYDVDESISILFDDGWFVSELNGAGMVGDITTWNPASKFARRDTGMAPSTLQGPYQALTEDLIGVSVPRIAEQLSNAASSRQLTRRDAYVEGSSIPFDLSLPRLFKDKFRVGG